MSDKATASHGAQWFVVAGFRGEEPSKDNTDFVVVCCEDLEASLRKAQEIDPEFVPVSALREAELRDFLGRIEREKALLKS